MPCTINQLLDLIESLSTSTVWQLRDRARQLRDRHGLKKRMKGLWKLRKKALVRLVAEVELERIDSLSANEEHVMLFKFVENGVAKAAILGAARAAQALGAETVEDYRELTEKVEEDVEHGKDVFNGSSHGLAHSNGQAKDEGKQEAKKAVKKS